MAPSDAEKMGATMSPPDSPLPEAGTQYGAAGDVIDEAAEQKLIRKLDRWIVPPGESSPSEPAFLSTSAAFPPTPTP
jgi:hypothetical protein